MHVVSKAMMTMLLIYSTAFQETLQEAEVGWGVGGQIREREKEIGKYNM